MIVHLKAQFELPLVSPFCPAASPIGASASARPRKGLLRPIPEVRLIPRIRRNRPAIRPGLMPFHRLRRRHKRRMLHHRHVVREGRIVLRPDHQPRHLVERITGLPSPIRPVGRVGVHIDVVAVVDAPVFRRLTD